MRVRRKEGGRRFNIISDARLLHVVTTYLTLSNYTWMLCEGSYLHFLLTMPFIEADITDISPLSLEIMSS